MTNSLSKVLIGLTLAVSISPLSLGHIIPSGLQCEGRADPQGIDTNAPLMTWQLNDTVDGERGLNQTAYQIQVAASQEMLSRNQGDLWDSGRVVSDQTTWIPYQGSKLVSQETCYWHVKVWDKNGQSSTWSTPASWSMGLLHLIDWKAHWISDPSLAAPTNRPLTPIHCYRSELSTKPDEIKWITLDLGSSQQMDEINLIPARPKEQSSDLRTALFPVRFKIEVSDNLGFSHAQLVADRTHSDFPNPRQASCRFNFPSVKARYVRLTVTRLAPWDGQDYGIALGGFDVYDRSRPVSIGADSQCSDSIESDRWAKRYLVDGKDDVILAADAPAIAADMKDVPAKNQVSRVPMLRRDFGLADKIKKATLYTTARGFYEVHINGQRVSQEFLAPGFTDYHVRLQYQTYDVTHLLHGGKNAIGALLGYGWYAGHMNLSDNRCIYGYFPQFLAQLDVELNNGKHQIISTDGQWRSTLDGPLRWSDLLDGEGYDCHRLMSGWDQPGFDDHSWQPVWSQALDQAALVWQRSQPVRKICEWKPVAIKEIKPGTYIFDFGQEISGWCRLKANGPDGTNLRLLHAEEVTPDGDIDVKNLWGTPQEEDYILDGHGPHTFEPHFTYHGFRYVKLSGFSGQLEPDTLVAVNIRTDMPITGKFECSNERYNRIQKASFWTEANLLFDVPAGCAARGERLAWTGDIRPCVQSLLFNFGAAPFLVKYAQDLRDDQLTNGQFTDICPQAHLKGTTSCVGSPGWADAGVSLPWEVYVNTGERQLLAQHFEAARRWVDFIHANNPDLIWRKERGVDWGDWLSAGRATPKELGATAFFAHSVDLVSHMAQVLARNDDAKKYHTLFQGIRAAFVKNDVNPNGIIEDNPSSQAVVRDVSNIVRSLVKDDKLAFTVQNDALGGDPILNHAKDLQLTYWIGDKSFKQQFAEGAKVNLTGLHNAPIKIISATYGNDMDFGDDAQGSYALALEFGLLDEPLRSKAAKRLDKLVVQNDHHPTTGFWSSSDLLLALSNTGFQGEAALMLNQQQEPSWGYMADHGTTMWEAFDAKSKNLSLDHWTHSAVSEWLWRNVAGINPDPQQPGYKSFTIRPRPTKEVSWCQASYDSIRGQIVSDWKCKDDKFSLRITVPINTTATVVVPTSAPDTVTEAGKYATNAEGVTFLRSERGTAIYKIVSGSYNFSSTFRPE
jgi:alpha-L-rhamnosidase